MNRDRQRLEQLLAQQPDELVLRVQDRVWRELEQHDHSLLLFGTGELGTIALHNLRAIGRTPAAFIDNNPARQGTDLQGVPILSPAETKMKFPGSLVVITVYTNAPVRRQLRELDMAFITFAELAWCYPNAFLPRVALDLPHQIFNQANDVRAAFELWNDQSSRAEYLAQLQWRCTLDPNVLPPHSPPDETYFAPDLFELEEDEVLVDCGAFDGDTGRAFLARRQDSFCRIIALEPDEQSRAGFESWRATLPVLRAKKIELLPFAAGEKRHRTSFNNDGDVTSALGAGAMQVEVAPLDELVAGRCPTFIKMDIEGSEPAALRGGREVLRREQPILAICVYHAQEHLWTIPQLIHSLNPDYQLFLRRYSDECWELICYAVPLSRCKG